MKYLLVKRLDDGVGGCKEETKVFSAKDDEDALIKAFGNPHNLSDEAADDPSWWFEEHTVCNMYFHGDIPDGVTLFRIDAEVKGAKDHMLAVHKAVERRRKERDDEQDSEKELEELNRLAKKHGKTVA